MGKDRNEEKMSEEEIDATLADSFPASDPPSWTLGREKYEQPTEKSKQTPRGAMRAKKRRQGARR